MRFSPFVERIAGQGVAAWDIHHAAFQASSKGEDIIILSVGDPDFATPRSSPTPPSKPCARAIPTTPKSPAARHCGMRSPPVTASPWLAR
ncbi:hypothetical protein [Pseudomonas sp. TH32]|uniref:hypothetical protein n=1 Tax=Pseudomonas sp. TH32 TaxID=2796397 RepID=UPI00406C9350